MQQKEVAGVKMLQSVLKKLGSFLIILLGITFLSFLLSYLSPSDPVEIMMKKKGNMVSEEVIERKREELGLNQPLVVQYVNWLKGIGNCETSSQSRLKLR